MPHLDGTVPVWMGVPPIAMGTSPTGMGTPPIGMAALPIRIAASQTGTREQEVQRLLEVLATVVRVAGRSRQSLERQIGLSSGYLSKILGA